MFWARHVCEFVLSSPQSFEETEAQRELSNPESSSNRWSDQGLVSMRAWRDLWKSGEDRALEMSLGQAELKN